MKLAKAVPIGAAVALAGWTLWGVFSSSVERARYEVLKRRRHYEIRQYPPRLLAQASVQGRYKRAVEEAFRILASYICGANRAHGRVMPSTTVEAFKAVAERIPMTAPVCVEQHPGAIYTVAFAMPAGYTRDNLPEPTDNRVRIVVEPARKVAALRFGWPRSRARVKAKERELCRLLARDHVETAGPPLYAGYNPPWTPPWLVRNEVMVELR